MRIKFFCIIIIISSKDNIIINLIYFIMAGYNGRVKGFKKKN